MIPPGREPPLLMTNLVRECNAYTDIECWSAYFRFRGIMNRIIIYCYRIGDESDVEIFGGPSKRDPGFIESATSWFNKTRIR